MPFRLLVALLLALRLGSGALAARPGDWTHPDLGGEVTAGAATARTLWLLGEEGRLVAFDRRTGARRRHQGAALDLLRDGPRLWILRQEAAGGRARIDDPRGGPGRSTPPLPGRALRLFATPAGVGVLTTDAVAIPRGPGWRILTLPRDAQGRSPLHGRVAAVLAVDGALLVGFDHGEWGGGLRRVDLGSGAVSQVENIDGDLCGGLLNPECDPVRGLIPDAARPHCAIAAIGLLHGLGSGRVVRVCGSTVTPVYEPRVEPGDVPPDRLAGRTWPLSGLIALDDGGWAAAAHDERLFIATGPVVLVKPIPPLRDWSGLRLNDDDPRFILVMRDCCWGLVDKPTRFDVLLVPVGP
ncbi:MAG TPA: hypothetical protein VEA44_16745 [Caulobacter sp.]|nr:hypothetical protein [Caulobacter sp.]